MAATNFTPISLYHTDTPGAQPTNTNLVNGELALNIYDGKLYYKDNNGDVQLLASKTTSSNVTSVSLVSANGFSGTVADPSTTPAITLTTPVSGVLKGSGGALVAASPGVDYAVPPSGSSILYANGSGGFSSVTIGSNLTFAGGTLSATGGGSSGVTSFNTRTGAVTLASSDVTTALGYTPVQSNGTGASGTWGINISGNAATATSATSASSATTAGSASYATTAGSASTATSASSATTATTATNLSGGSVNATSGTFSSVINANGGILSQAFTMQTGNSIFCAGSGQPVQIAVGGNYPFYFYSTGTANATLWNSTSDARIKENILPLTDGLSTVSKLNPIRFSFKKDAKTQPNHYGLLAQELEQVIPDVVFSTTQEDHGVQNIKTVSYSEIIPILIKAVQELKAEVDALKAAK